RTIELNVRISNAGFWAARFSVDRNAAPDRATIRRMREVDMIGYVSFCDQHSAVGHGKIHSGIEINYCSRLDRQCRSAIDRDAATNFNRAVGGRPSRVGEDN